jgi:hypothetical protein
MKSIKSLFFLYMVLGLTFVSCTKTRYVSPAPAKEAYMTCLVDGEPWTAKATVAMQSAFTDIRAIKPNGQMIELYLGGRLPGYYEIGPGNGNTASIGPNDGSDQAKGYAVITSLDRDNRLISGTFNFTVVLGHENSKRTITNGTFTNVPY